MLAVTKKSARKAALIMGVFVLCAAGVLSRSQPHAYGVTNGRIAFALVDLTSSQIYTINADGTDERPLTSGPDSNTDPAWSPDGSKIAYVGDTGGNTIIRTMNADGSNQTDITDGSTSDFLPKWSPDGSKIAFVSDGQIAVMNANGSNKQVLTSDTNGAFYPSWKPDGSSIVFACDDGTHTQLCTINADGTGEAALTNDAHDHTAPSWSPDGSKLVLIYSPSRYDDHVATADADGSNIQVVTTSNNETANPSWSPDGTKILYDDLDPGPSTQRIYYVNPDGSGETVVTPDDGNNSSFPSWQPVFDTDGDGSLDTAEGNGPNHGDANGDSVADETQANVTSLVNPLTGKYTVLQTSCTANSGLTISAEPAAYLDSAFSYPQGLLGFTLHCGVNGATATVNQYYYGLAADSTLVLRKYNPAAHSYQTISDAAVAAVSIGGQTATKVTYQIKDGGPLDQDGSANGVIVDPVGIAQPSVGAPDTGLGGTAR